MKHIQARKRRKALRQLNEAVEFTLEKYNLKAKWKIIPLTFDKWKIYKGEEHKLNVVSGEMRKSIVTQIETGEFKELLRKGNKKALEMKGIFERAKELEKEVLKEDGRDLTKEELLRASASYFYLKRESESIKKLIPFHTKMKQKHKDIDFLIPLNKALRESRRIKLHSVVHETLHFIDEINGTTKAHEEIEKETRFIVSEFLKKRN